MPPMVREPHVRRNTWLFHAGPTFCVLCFPNRRRPANVGPALPRICRGLRPPCPGARPRHGGDDPIQFCARYQNATVYGVLWYSITVRQQRCAAITFVLRRSGTPWWHFLKHAAVQACMGNGGKMALLKTYAL
ncbi:hypothetical protein N657DRAFT_642972 [Parathielavia appendiculata]|uniref:Uncharacterized protein n=1 Tax=Parathielavia appendiculata TaxID=2587402 RepID=A0AAN6Z6B4_9PEZI|nr:hypothetical protein N657DRAFT_642972 [Parathielavia appendiculata]